MQILDEIIYYKKQFLADRIKPNTFWRKYKSLRKEFYASIEWQAIRREVRQRDVVCACGEMGRDVDHIQLLYDRPDLALNPENLQYICLKCHKAKHRKLNKRGRLSSRAKSRY